MHWADLGWCRRTTDMDYIFTHLQTPHQTLYCETFQLQHEHFPLQPRHTNSPLDTIYTNGSNISKIYFNFIIFSTIYIKLNFHVYIFLEIPYHLLTEQRL